MAKLEAVIFDLDGVIVSTDRYHYLGWKRLADEIGVPFDRERNELCRGVDRMASLRIVLGPNRKYSEAEMRGLADRKNEYYKELAKQITPADMLPGVSALLAELEAHGVKRAVGSASKNAEAVIERLGIREKFVTIVTGHDFTRGKPAPDVFLTAASRLGVAPANCVVFEDAAAGVEAAHAGGMKAVGVGRPDLLAAAERVVGSLAEITYADLVRLMA